MEILLIVDQLLDLSSEDRGRNYPLPGRPKTSLKHPSREEVIPGVNPPTRRVSLVESICYRRVRFPLPGTRLISFMFFKGFQARGRTRTSAPIIDYSSTSSQDVRRVAIAIWVLVTSASKGAQRTHRSG